jgi:hypothetical protein
VSDRPSSLPKALKAPRAKSTSASAISKNNTLGRRCAREGGVRNIPDRVE